MPVPHWPSFLTAGTGQGGVAEIAKYMETVCAHSLWQGQATQARAHRGAKVSVVPAVGKKDTFTDGEPQGSNNM